MLKDTKNYMDLPFEMNPKVPGTSLTPPVLDILYPCVRILENSLLVTRDHDDNWWLYIGIINTVMVFRITNTYNVEIKEVKIDFL